MLEALPAPKPPPIAALDRLCRLAYRLGFRAMLLWWRLRRPEHRGAVVALWLEGKVLLVRQSYRVRPVLPGGGVRRGEAPRQAACRELAEELGLELAEEALAFAGEWVGWMDHRRDHVSLFEHHLGAPPALRLDNREIVAADFVAPEEALAGPLPPFLRPYLEAALAAGDRDPRPCPKQDSFG